MTIDILLQKEPFTVLSEGDRMRQITGVFCCDLLSIAMSKATADYAWVTVMGNLNTLAVASLTDVACVILAEGTALEEAVIEKAKAQGITVLSTDRPVFETALGIHRLLEG